ncbi:gustatory receptor 94a [Musca autumnalis]|uniref:gustatory receptor 94a n=1 Tax=Musca autumnalis TaxID=221902 RepID=UPI003CF6B77A
MSVGHLYVAFDDGKINLANAETLYYYISIVGVVLSYISQLAKAQELQQFLSSVPFFEVLNYFELKSGVVKSSVRVILVKTIMFPIIIEMGLIVRQAHYEPDKSLFQTLSTLYPVVVSNFLPNCVFSSMVICHHTMNALNIRLQQVEKKANFYQDVKQMILHKQFQRMQTFCDLADKLDELSEKYTQICRNTLKYVDINSLAILAALLSNLFAITGGFFQQYTALSDTIINKDSYDLFDALTNGVFLAVAAADVGLYGSLADDCLGAVRETSIILKRIQLNNCDIRFRQSVERFSLQIFVENFKIQPMGMLEINVGLLHDVLSAVTSFLLILIQSDLTLRFSLK